MNNHKHARLTPHGRALLVRRVLDEAEPQLKENLRKLGFELQQSPSRGTLKVENEKVQIEHNVQGPMKHFDAKA